MLLFSTDVATKVLKKKVFFGTKITFSLSSTTGRRCNQLDLLPVQRSYDKGSKSKSSILIYTGLLELFFLEPSHWVIKKQITHRLLFIFGSHFRLRVNKMLCFACRFLFSQFIYAIQNHCMTLKTLIMPKLLSELIVCQIVKLGEEKLGIFV